MRKQRRYTAKTPWCVQGFTHNEHIQINIYTFHIEKLHWALTALWQAALIKHIEMAYYLGVSNMATAMSPIK